MGGEAGRAQPVGEVQRFAGVRLKGQGKADEQRVERHDLRDDAIRLRGIVERHQDGREAILRQCGGEVAE